MASAMDQLSGLAGLLKVVNGTDQKTKTSQTTQTNVSDAGVSELIRQMLSGPGGVKSIGNAARSTGLYSSTTEDKALSDLYSSAAVKAELARSPTTTNTTQTVQSPGALGGSLGTIGGLIAGGTALNALTNGAIGEGLSNIVGGLFNSGASNVTSEALGGAVSQGVADTIGAVLPAGAAGSIPGLGNFVSGLFGDKKDALDPTNLATSAAMGAATMGPIGAVAAPVASIAGSILGGLSVVCTVLAELGDISPARHKLGEKYLHSLPSQMKIGYWAWGIPVARKIRNGSKFWRYFTRPIVRQYIELAALQKRTWKEYLRYPAGSLAVFIGEPMCSAIGWLILKKDILVSKIELQAK